MLLQLGVEQAYTDYLIHFAVTLIAMMLGLCIVFQAFRGYRRNDSERMLFLAIGLALLTLAPFALSILGDHSATRSGSANASTRSTSR